MLARLNHDLFCIVLIAILSRAGRVLCRQSVWSYNIDQSQIQDSVFPSYLYKGSYVSVTVLCDTLHTPDFKIRVTWAFEEVHCMEQMYKENLKGHSEAFSLEQELQRQDKKSRKKMLQEPPPSSERNPRFANSSGSDVNAGEVSAASLNTSTPDVIDTPPMAFQVSLEKFYSCGHHSLLAFEDESDRPYRVVTYPKKVGEKPIVATVDQSRPEPVSHRVVTAWEDGMYHFLLLITPKRANGTFQAQVLVQIHNRHGYLSAIDWPLLPYHGTMAFLYLMLTTTWIMVWARSHRYTLKIHVVMGVVAVAGSMAHTLQFVQSASENSNGGGVMVILWFAKLLSVIQLSLFNLVVLIVSTGYGIILPTLPRPTLIKMIVLCVIQFILGIAWEIVADETLHLQYDYPTPTKVILWLKRVIIVIIAAWIMWHAVRALLHLRQRSHSSSKVVTFTVFMVSCSVVFLGQVAVFIVSIGWMQACRTQWHWQWIFMSFTSMTALFLLVVLMVLWRPVDTGQSYAFSPVGVDNANDTDDEDDEEYELDSHNSEKSKLEPL